MSRFDEMAKNCQAMFISVDELIELILEYDSESKDHIPNLLNAKFFANQTCMVKDGYALAVIRIDQASDPDYKAMKQAILDKLENRPNELLHDYGFSRKRTLTNLEKIGIFVDSELIAQAKSFVPDDDHQDETGAYYECLPYEYALLHRDYQELERKYQNANTEKTLDDLDVRTLNNFVRLLLAINQIKSPLDFSKNKMDSKQLQQINDQLDLLGYRDLKETAYRTLIELISEKISKGL